MDILFFCCVLNCNHYLKFARFRSTVLWIFVCDLLVGFTTHISILKTCVLTNLEGQMCAKKEMTVFFPAANNQWGINFLKSDHFWIKCSFLSSACLSSNIPVHWTWWHRIAYSLQHRCAEQFCTYLHFLEVFNDHSYKFSSGNKKWSWITLQLNPTSDLLFYGDISAPISTSVCTV